MHRLLAQVAASDEPFVVLLGLVSDGNGLKDTAIAEYAPDITKSAATVEGVERALGW